MEKNEQKTKTKGTNWKQKGKDVKYVQIYLTCNSNTHPMVKHQEDVSIDLELYYSNNSNIYNFNGIRIENKKKHIYDSNKLITLPITGQLKSA